MASSPSPADAAPSTPADTRRVRPRNGAKAASFRQFLVDTYGQAALARGAGLLDIAGGQATFSWELLNFHGIPTTVVDPRPATRARRFERRFEHWQRRHSGQQEHEEEEEIFPVYIGDDVTDEDAFRMMGELGGLGIIVSETAMEGLTAASYALHNPLEVVHFLDHFAQLNQLPQLSLGQMKAEPILEGAEEGAALEEPPFSRSSSSHL